LIQYLVYAAGIGLCASGYVQAFLLSAGMDVEGIGWYGAAMQGSSLCAYALFLAVPVRPGTICRMLVGYCAVMAFYPLGLLFLSLSGGIPSAAQWLLVLHGVLFAAVSALQASGEFSAIPFLFPRQDYGRLSAKGGMLGSIFGLIIGLGGVYALRNAEGMRAYSSFFLAATILFALRAWLNAGYRPLASAEAEKMPRLTLCDTMKRCMSWRMLWRLAPHALRGAGAAGMYYFPVILLGEHAMNGMENALFITVGICAVVLGNFLFLRCGQRAKPERVTLVANTVCAICGLLVTLGLGFGWGLAFYGVFSMANTLSGIAIPVCVLLTTSTEDLAMISSLRMLAMSGMTFLCMPPFARLLAHAPIVVMGVAGVLNILTGTVFCLQRGR